MVSESLGSLASLYITSCGIEGKSPETLRSYAETLKIFMRVVKHLRLPDDPGLFRPANVYEFLGHIGSTGVSAVTQWRRQRETRAFFSWLCRSTKLAVFLSPGIPVRESTKPLRSEGHRV